MNKKRIMLICATFLIVIASISVVSAGLFDFGGINVKTHEFNLADTISFNISDDLTNKTEAPGVTFTEGVSYKYPNSESVFQILPLVEDNASDALAHNRNDALYKEVKVQNTTQKFNAVLFELEGIGEYEVIIDLNNTVIPDGYGFDMDYKYISADFKTKEEAQIFMDTFKLNEKYLK